MNLSFEPLAMPMPMPPAVGDLSQRFALDVQGVEPLRHTARAEPQQAAAQVARQFEAMLLHMMLKSMRDATAGGGLFESEHTRYLTSLYDRQLAQQLSSRGIGLADVLQQQLTRHGEPTARQAASNHPPQKSLHAALQAPAQATAATVMQSFQTLKPRSNTALAPAPRAFLQRLTPIARATSAATGIPVRLMLSQAALESGWGRREIRHPDGTPSHNLFGIKAGPGWAGPVVQTHTTEYVDGAPRKLVAHFRAYPSYHAAFADYARLLTDNPRYAAVLAARTEHEAAWGLQRANYATDPHYAAKLIDLMRQIDA